ncbi:MBL fold metallo-hydrolase [Rhizobium leguminosarum]|uniref:MBL fold metallo-hydrolase n=1 Tax=Rhizobium leguminosarum TaxID=384 RepID=UPI001C987DAA|nr:MBL fold metallo-hydrolase [Rhizobium leguminosarum]MBY5349078.1 MBL fold metallo-hydrolase [Rhizobium leguminosarum]
MTTELFQVKFWGVRGSIPVSGPEFDRYGGNTSCIEIRCGEHRMIFDAGSGLREAGLSLLADSISDVDLFFSHCHYDHIIGLPFFKAIYYPSINVNIWSGHLDGKMSTREMVEQFISPPWFPVKTDICQATMNFRDFHAGQVLTPHAGIEIKTFMLNHPGGAIGYRIEWQGRSVALVYDIEHIPGRYDPVSLEMMRDADLVVYDCTYNEDEMQRFKGFGHSTWQHGTELAKIAGAKRFALFHHAPSRTDEQLGQMEMQAQAAFPESFAARDNQVVVI